LQRLWLRAADSDTTKAQQAKIIKVQTGKVVKMESLVQTVSASGEIKPLKYINITANSYGRSWKSPSRKAIVSSGAICS
jgi:hypothetical protein